jgi:phage protein D
MPDNRRLVPVCLIAVNGRRLDTAYEGALRSVRVIDRLNGVSRCSIVFDAGGLQPQIKDFPGFGSSLSVQLGYKDDLDEVFNGDLTARRLTLSEYGEARYELTGSGVLHRLDHGQRLRVFERKSYSRAVGDILDEYGLRGEVESFGPDLDYWEGGPRTDLDLIVSLAGRYGWDIRAFGEQVTVAGRMRDRGEEIIYEWGKSLISFRDHESIRRQISGSRFIGWDPRRGEGFSGRRGIGEVREKVGGNRDWTQEGRGGDGRWEAVIFEHGLADRRDAEERALGKAQETGFGYKRAEGSGEGNPRLRAGMGVTVKNVGKAAGGEYIAADVTHDFSMEGGYITEFGLKRNMGQGGAGAGIAMISRQAAAYRGGPVAAGSEAEEREEEEEEKRPEITNLRWMKDGGEIREALAGDEVTLYCEVRDVNNGERVDLTVWEHDDDEEHDHVEDLSGTVENGKVEVKWEVVYVEDLDDSTSGKELAEKGYTLPEYHFVAKHGDTGSKPGPVMKVAGRVMLQLIDEPTGKPLSDNSFIVSLADGRTEKRTIDSNGYIDMKGVPFGIPSIKTG